MQQENASLESARYDLSKVRIESPIKGIVTKRNIEEGETVVIGTMNNAGTVLLTIADMSVIEAEVEVDETDIPTREVRPGRQDHHRRDPRQDLHRARSPRSATARSPPPARRPAQATNFKVVVTLDTEIPEVRPGFTCTAEITTANRKNVVAVPIQATTVREMVVDEKGDVVRETADAAKRPRPGAVQASELKPGQSRKELEGVFVVRDAKAMFVPVKTGIAGDKYFEVLSGVKDGDSVVVGPFASVRELADNAPVKVEAATTRTGAAKQ